MLAILGLVRISSTYGTFSATIDEPFHLAAGMEILQRGTYFRMTENPPLPPIAFALGPYLKGLPVSDNRSGVEAGTVILTSDGEHRFNLTLARLGNLPFYVLACVVVFVWGHRWFGLAAGLWGAALFSTLPPVLGHAGLATTDMASAASVPLALFHLLRWLEEPSDRRAIWLGLAVAFALLCKFSFVPFFLLASLACLPRLRTIARAPGEVKKVRRHAALALGVAFMTVWAGYGFALNSISEFGDWKRYATLLFKESPRLFSAAQEFAEFRLPLSAMLVEAARLLRHAALGHPAYLFGEWSRTGWWYFFPVVLAVKTPIAFLLLTATGMLSVLLARGRTWQQAATIGFAGAILAVAMCSTMNLGVRHILCIYPLLAILAGHAVAMAWNRSKSPALMLACLTLAVWHFGESLRAHPDYLAYFNQAGGKHPEKILTGSDLDWGQDLDRLAHRLRELNVERVTIKYFGSTPLELAGLPNYKILGPEDRPAGYVAISLTYLMRYSARDGSYAWLKQLTPMERIGKSINLYFIAPPKPEKNAN